mmetsp:Transcript_2796/g.8241  ORF Transcript_2796/g.8241 Transcript_2796/m.8241 type:complete len:201 (+) Transcript_2796:182-784(+)
MTTDVSVPGLVRGRPQPCPHPPRHHAEAGPDTTGAHLSQRSAVPSRSTADSLRLLPPRDASASQRPPHCGHTRSAATHAQRPPPFLPPPLGALGCLPIGAAWAFAPPVGLGADFLAVCLARLRSLTSRSAASRAAARTSGFWLRFALISSSDAPTTAWLAPLFCTLRVRFLDASSSVPFLCSRRYICVHASLRGFHRLWK